MKTLGVIFLIHCLTIPSICNGQILPGSRKNCVDSPDEAGVWSLIISEIMADPHPAVALPDAEYLEIYNRGSTPVSLEGYRLFFGDNLRILSSRLNPDDVSVEPGDFIILCDEEDSSAFESMGKILLISHMPAIVNTGATLVLESPSRKVIHSVSFTDTWYRSAEKEGGGWSLEIIDPDNPCGRDGNWCESKDISGGTPGTINSVNAKNPDRKKPELLRASLDPDSSVVLYFNEDMDIRSVTDPLNYYATRGLGHPSKADAVKPAFSRVTLWFNGELCNGLTYSVTVLNTLKDCVGNPLQNNAQADFAIPQPADSFDVVINELLFDTPSGVSEFIELFNRSHKAIDLAGFSIALLQGMSDSILRRASMEENSFLLFPEHYAVLTRKADRLPDTGNRLDLSGVIELPFLFPFPDKEGKIAILNKEDQIMDLLFYNPSMHSIFIKEKEGISLERINADQPTNEPGNWYSSAIDKACTTPGYRNSQEISFPGEDETIFVSPSVFSPDEDGADDEVFLTLVPGGPGFIGNIEIYDLQGRRIKTICANRLLGTENILSWDGKYTNNQVAPPGIYLICIELFNREGIVKNYRKVVTLARRLMIN